MPIIQGVKSSAPMNDGIRVSGDQPEPEAEETSSSKPIIGIIYPPPEVRNIVDKTASFVARNGPEFEARIRQNEINNSKFNFLSGTDPYHAYYRHKVRDFLEGKGQEPAVPKGSVQATKASVAAIQEQFIPKEPPPPYEFIAEPPSIAAFDLDVVRLTAQFVARNGRGFLTQLMQKEAKNYQFDFLRPQHSLFQYFTKLVEQFTKVLIPPKNLMAKLKIESEDSKKILDDVRYRVEWSKHEERLHAREKEELEREHMAYAQIDWHDFVVVETVDFHPDERGNFPAPVSMHEIGARILQQERYERYGEDTIEKPTQNQQVIAATVESDVESEEETEDKISERKEAEQANAIDMDMEESDDEDSGTQVQAKSLSVAAPSDGNMIIRRDYNPKQKMNQSDKQTGEKMVISALTGEKIPASKLQEHMHVALLDPNWKEIRKRQITDQQNEEEVFAGGSHIHAALKGIAERRTDIFGVEETAIGKKVGEKELGVSDAKLVWDGHSSSIESTRRQAQSNTSVEEQIQAIHKAQGLLTDDSLDKMGLSTSTQPKASSAASTSSSINVPQVRPVAQSRAVLTPVVQLRPVINVPVQQPQQLLVVRQQMQPVLQQAPQQLVRVAAAAPVHAPIMMQQTPVMPQATHQMQVDEPVSKRQRTEGNLIPEQDFLTMHGHGAVTFRVICPSSQDKPDWKLYGQTMTFTLPLTDEVSVIKSKLHEGTGMPSGKQKLQLEGTFIKDSNSLAYYNITNGSVIHLQIKERGGRKK